MSEQEQIAFLQEQLAGAVMQLRVQEGHIQQLSGQMTGYDERVRKIYRDKHDRDEANNKQLRLSVAHLAQLAARYQFLRQYQVQVWKLGIAAEGDALDRLIDARLESVVQP